MWDFYISFIDGFRQTILYFFVALAYIVLKLWKVLVHKDNFLIAIFKIVVLLFYFEYFLIYIILKILSIGSGSGGAYFGSSEKYPDETRYYSYTDSDGNPCDQYGSPL